MEEQFIFKKVLDTIVDTKYILILLLTYAVKI